MARSTYEIRVTVTDKEPGRARADARSDLLDLLRDAGIEPRLHDADFALNHQPEIAEVIDP